VKNRLITYTAILAGALALAGCATLQQQPPAASAAPAATAETGQDKGKLPPFASATHEVMYKIMVAEMAGYQGDYALSAQYYYDSAQQTRNADLAERAAEVALHAKNYDLALDAAGLWSEIDPASDEARQISLAVLLRKGRNDEALAELDKLLALSPEISDQRLATLIKLLRPDTDRAVALEIIDKLMSKRKPGAETLLLQAHLLFSLKEYQRAEEALEKLFALNPRDEDGIELYIEVLSQQKKYPQAVGWMARLMAKNPNRDSWRMLYARLLVSAGDTLEAINQFKILLRKAPEDPDVIYALGLLSLQAKQPAEAKRYLLKLLAANRQRDSAYYFMAQAAELEKGYDEAIQWYRKVGKGQHYLNAQARISVLLAETGRFDEGLKHLQQVETDDPAETIELHVLEAELFAKHKRYAEAIAVYDRALQDAPNNFDLLYSRALLAEKMDRLDILEQDLRKIIALDPKHADAINALGYSLADRTDRHEEALQLIRQALELKPDAFYILDSMGWVLYRMGRHEESIGYLRKALAAKDDPEIAAHLGEALWMGGHKDEARKLLREAAQRFPEDEKLRATIQRLQP
jgi:tetratricopeptide (TPR) repeat protein